MDLICLIQIFIWNCFGRIAGPVLYGFWHSFICWLFLFVFLQHYMPQSFESKLFRSIWSPYMTLNVLKQSSVTALHSSGQLNSFRVQSLKRFCQCLPGHSLSHALVLALNRSLTEWARANCSSHLSRTFFWWNFGQVASGPAELVPMPMQQHKAGPLQVFQYTPMALP